MIVPVKLFMTINPSQELEFKEQLKTNPEKFENKIVFVNGAKSNYIIVNGVKYAEHIPEE